MKKCFIDFFVEVYMLILYDLTVDIIERLIMSKFINKICKSISMIFKFARNDLKKRYSGSIGGILWAYVLPLVTILVFWFVFGTGLRSNPGTGSVPYIIWLVPAYIAWTFINDSISQSSNVLYEYNFLVKKVKFQIGILPIVKVAVSFLIHIFFILFCVALYGVMSMIDGTLYLSWMTFQTLYYTFALSCFVIAIAYLVSALTVFYKDIAQIVLVLLQIGFWTVPIFWDPSDMSSKVVTILKLNPAFYVVQGYRESFLGTAWFFEHGWLTLYFWCITGLLMFLSFVVFKKCSKHYSDLL